MKVSLKISLPVLALFALCFLAGCAAGPPPVTYEEPLGDETLQVPQDETFNPLTVGDDVIVLPESNLDAAPLDTELETETPQKEAEAAMEEVPGYRVQLFTSDVEFEARAVEEKALLEFDENVYLIFDSPTYKIRVGDCTSRLDANALRKKAFGLGYRDAWVIQSRVIVPVTR
jgi:phosphotransferase system IIA component